MRIAKYVQITPYIMATHNVKENLGGNKQSIQKDCAIFNEIEFST